MLPKSQRKMDVVIATNIQTCEEAIQEIIESGVTHIGLDTETSVNDASLGREKANREKVSLISIYDGKKCYLIQTYRIWLVNKRLPKILKNFLKTRSIVKTGVDITVDSDRIFKSYGIELKGSIDLQYMGVSFSKPICSMIDLIKLYMPNKLSLASHKEIGHNSNWDKNLDESSVRYASLDAYFSRELYWSMISSRTEHVPKSIPTSNILSRSNKSTDPLSDLDKIFGPIPLVSEEQPISTSYDKTHLLLDPDYHRDLTVSSSKSSIDIPERCSPMMVFTPSTREIFSTSSNSDEIAKTLTKHELTKISQWFLKEIRSIQKSRTIESLVNQAANSIGCLVTSYSIGNRKKLLKPFIIELISKHGIKQDPYNGSVLKHETYRHVVTNRNCSCSSNDALKFYTEYSGQLYGMKFEKAVNKAANSYSYLAQRLTNIDDRKVWVQTALNYLQKKNKISFVGPARIIVIT